MSVYRTPNSPYWQYDFRYRGDRFHGSTKRTKKTEAKAFVTRLKAQLETGASGKKELTLDEAAALYLGQKGGDETTMYQLENLIRLHGELTLLSQIDNAAVAAVISKRRGEKHRRFKKNAPLVSPASVNRETALLRRVIRHASKQGVAVCDIDWNGHMLKESADRDPILTKEQQERLIAEAADHLKAPIEFALITGKRLAEVTGLDWSQVDLNARSMVFRVKGGKLHRIPIIPEVFDILLRQGPKETGRVFLYKGQPVKSWRTAWEGAKRRAGVNLRWHDLRHVAASRMVANGVDISVVKEVLAHSEITTTMRYVKHQQSALADAMKAGNLQNSRKIPEVDEGEGS